MIFGDNNIDVSLNMGSVGIKKQGRKVAWSDSGQILCFKQQIRSICEKAGQKLHSLSRISLFFDTEQLKRIMKAFILSRFSYYPVVWMLCDSTLDNKVNRIHERALQITYRYEIRFLHNVAQRQCGPNPHWEFTVADYGCWLRYAL